jgi:hypothetical protein
MGRGDSDELQAQKNKQGNALPHVKHDQMVNEELLTVTVVCHWTPAVTRGLAVRVVEQILAPCRFTPGELQIAQAAHDRPFKSSCRAFVRAVLPVTVSEMTRFRGATVSPTKM